MNGKGVDAVPGFFKIVLLFSAAFLICTGLSPQEWVHERVEVIYQEMLVRVFDGAKPVPGLKAGDFTVYEDGKPVKVSYCRELRRSLTKPENEADAPAAEKAKPRLFLFMLWFNEESREWPTAWEYFLTRIYRAGDRIILSGGEQAVEITSPENDREKMAAFFAGLAKSLKQKELTKARLVNDLERSTAEFYEDLIFIPSANQSAREALEKSLLERFKTSYLGVLDDYRLARLKGYPLWLERLADALKAVEAEKWALVFLQNERLPLLSREGRLFRQAPLLQATISELKRFMEDTERRFQLGSDVMSLSARPQAAVHRRQCHLSCLSQRCDRGASCQRAFAMAAGLFFLGRHLPPDQRRHGRRSVQYNSLGGRPARGGRA